MTPLRRDRNLLRVRRATGVIAGASLAATGLFAGLAASKPKTATASRTVVAPTVRQRPATTRQQTTTQQTQVQTQAPAIVVTPTQQAPVASSGGS